MNARDTLRREISLYDPGNGIAVDLLAIDELLRAFIQLNSIQCEDWADQNAQLLERAISLGYGDK